MRLRKFRKHAISVLIVLLFAWQQADYFTNQGRSDFPNKPIQIVVPYLAGGGTDTFARIIQNSLNETNRLGVPVVILNQDGGSATVGSRYVKNSPADGYRLLCHHEGIIATKLAGVVDYGVEAFRPVAQTGSIVLLMVVRADSKHKSLVDLLKAAQLNPNEIRVGANQGSPAYFICRQILSEYAGANFNFVSASGAKRFSYLLGGKLDAGIFSLAEYLAFRNTNDAPPSENILAIGNFGLQRHPAITDVATSAEQGFQTQAENAFYFWAPLETPDSVVEVLASAFEHTLKDPLVIDQLDRLSLDPIFRSGLELEQHLKHRVEAFEKLAVEVDADLPDFAFWVIVTVIILLGFVIFQAYFDKDKPATDHPFSASQNIPFNLQGGTSLVILLGYVTALQVGVPFIMSTPLAIFLIGGTIAKWQSKHLYSLAQIALLGSSSIHLIFTEIFTVALP